MNDNKRVLLLIGIMASVAVIAVLTTISILYRTAIGEEEARLTETVKSQARLLESVDSFDTEYGRNYPKGPRQASIDQIVNAPIIIKATPVPGSSPSRPGKATR